ncbi:hypothetical protein UF75_4639 [Desulfosporosinus sp. I2]|nr:hypothetical protein UF75_4639 [Desulfosporosinus sp. I2]
MLLVLKSFCKVNFTNRSSLKYSIITVESNLTHKVPFDEP